MAPMVVLRRYCPTRNMARFYALTLENSLFGEVLLVRRWGRIGTHGRIKVCGFDAVAPARAELARIARLKVRRGYEAIYGWTP